MVTHDFTGTTIPQEPETAFLYPLVALFASLVAFLARHLWGRGDEEEHPTRAGEPAAAVRLLLGPEDGGRPGWSPISRTARLLFGGEDGDDGGWNLVFGPKDDDGEPGWWIAGPTGGDDCTWKLLFGSEDDRGGGWSILRHIALCHARPLWPDKRDSEEDHHSSHSPRYFLLPQGRARYLIGPSSYPVFPLPINLSLFVFEAIDESDEDSKGHRPLLNGEEDGEYRPHQRGGATRLTRLTLAPEDPPVDSPIKCKTRPSFIDEDDEDRYPSFGDDDDEEAELGGWYHSRLPGYARTSGGGASLLTRPCGSPLHISPIGGDGRRPLFDDEKPDDEGWERSPRPPFPLAAHPAGHGPIWPTEPPDADRRPPFLFGDDDEHDGEWGRSAHLVGRAKPLQEALACQ